MMNFDYRCREGLLCCVTQDKLKRITEDVVTFDAHCFPHLYLHEMPFSQCVQRVEVAKMNQLRREGIRYSRVLLHDYDTCRATSSTSSGR